MGKVKKNYNYILSFLILTMIMILGITSNPIKIYADEKADWDYYQDEDKDKELFDEMDKAGNFEREWNSFSENIKENYFKQAKEKYNEAEWNSFDDKKKNDEALEKYKSSRFNDLYKRVIIKYTLLQPDKNGQKVIYKDYVALSSVGTGADYGEVFNYETDWESNVETVEVWLPSTVNKRSETVINPGEEYKRDPEDPDNVKGIGGYGGNYCMAWAGQFYNTMESQEERAMFPSKGFGVWVVCRNQEKRLFSGLEDLSTDKEEWRRRAEMFSFFKFDILCIKIYNLLYNIKDYFNGHKD